LSPINDQPEREIQKVENKRAALANVNKALDEAGQLILKAEIGEMVGARMVDSM
jgi:hypothetical protein